MIQVAILPPLPGLYDVCKRANPPEVLARALTWTEAVAMCESLNEEEAHPTHPSYFLRGAK